MSTLNEWQDYLPDYLDGLKVTLRLTGVSLAGGLPLGLLLALAMTARRRTVRWPAILLVEIGRGAPALVVLYFVYYGLPQLDLTWSSFVCAAIALGFTTAAYTADIFRAGINSIPVGHREACQALGLSHGQELRLVVLPQAIRVVIPPLIGFCILLYQGTSLAFAVSVPELLSRAYSQASITYQFTSTLVLAGLVYAAISLSAVALMRARWPGRTASVTDVEPPGEGLARTTEVTHAP
ncbi:amino acid ABC transporter permease [Nocardioides marmoriginsengisoli]|uniref:Amino acid ABC transporter permease n=1 Tax=Nocardioides marmoriginsengisoli TaxID=661483 RepID=A0A3N0CG37_9ACTN|nr:amino acid ABC transporter permease [Nocardioides marmoriginsengisoli]RNL61953.1 amino acid ABC transporter permease [Nocardioides marmoriginsengisoli]